MIVRRWRAGALVLLALLLASCSGLGGEPAIVSTVPPQPTTAPERGYPAQPPDIASGAAIFAARCTECHGAGGAGDGTRVQSGQIQNIPNFLDPAVPGSQRVSDWYTTITNGRIENLMPPWANALSEQQRWDVAYYTYLMHHTPEQLARGAEIFTESCAGCHGASGRGDGPDAASLSGAVGDLTDLANMATLSDDHIFTTISEGVGDPQDGMPAFADQLSADDIHAVTGYVRTLGLASAEPLTVAVQATSAPQTQATTATSAPTAAAQPTTAAVAPEPVSTEEPAAGSTITITGTVTNGTANGEVPSDLSVSLFVFPQGEDPIEIEQTVDANGGYRFEDVFFAEDAAYAITANYRDRLFLSEITSGQALGPNPVIDLSIYELTDDPSVLTITLIETQINVNADTDSLEVAQFMEVENSSDRAYTTTQVTPDGRPISLAIPLPPGSIVPGFTERSRYAYLSDEYTVVDTQLVYPGEIHLVQLVYIIPYSGSAIIEQELGYTFAGLDQLLVRPDGVQVNAEGLASMGTTTVGGREFMSYSGTFTRPAGSLLRVELSGTGSGGPSSFDPGGAVVSGDSAALVLVGGAILLGVLIGIFIWTRRRSTPPEPPKVTAESLAKQIADLDAAHAAGEISDSAWKKQRAELKNRLTQLLVGGDES
ncbi:MAG: c-type cytochrome [Anaerolineae bacterium]